MVISSPFHGGVPDSNSGWATNHSMLQSWITERSKIWLLPYTSWMIFLLNFLYNKGFVYKQLHRTLLKYYPEFFQNNDVFIRKK